MTKEFGAIPAFGPSDPSQSSVSRPSGFNPGEGANLPVISLWQPFASLIFTWDRERGDFAKCNETRGFRLPTRLIGRPVGIQATAKFPAARHISEQLNDLCYQLWGCGYNYSLPFGAIIGIVRFGHPVATGEAAPFQCDSELAAGNWAPGRWAWPIVEAEELTAPVPAKGRQGWWSIEAAALKQRRVG